MTEINEALARKVLDTVNAGLVSGLGEPTPGKMCVEAAVCYAMGLPHSDKPTCVGSAVRAFKISLNDAQWTSNAARAEGLRKLAIAQLGSEEIDQAKFVRIVVEQTIRQIVPRALRLAKKGHPKIEHREALEDAAIQCEKDGNRKAALSAKKAAYAAASVSAASDAAANAAAAAGAAASAVNAYAYAAADYAYAAADYAYAAGAAAAAAAAVSAAADAARDEILNLACSIGLAALIECNSPGCAYLFLVEESQP